MKGVRRGAESVRLWAFVVLGDERGSAHLRRCQPLRLQWLTMKTSWLVTGASLSFVSSPAADAFHANGQGGLGLPRGASGKTTRGGQSLAATSGFDLGNWLKKAFNPPTAAAMEKAAR